jgi:hypothetical protein
MMMPRRDVEVSSLIKYVRLRNENSCVSILRSYRFDHFAPDPQNMRLTASGEGLPAGAKIIPIWLSAVRLRRKANSYGVVVCVEVVLDLSVVAFTTLPCFFFPFVVLLKLLVVEVVPAGPETDLSTTTLWPLSMVVVAVLVFVSLDLRLRGLPHHCGRHKKSCDEYFHTRRQCI